MLLEQLLVPFGPKNSDIHSKTIKIVSVLQLRSICIEVKIISIAAKKAMDAAANKKDRLIRSSCLSLF